MPRKTTKKKTVPVGKKIRSFRLEKKMSLDRLANDTGFSIDHLKQIESGKIMPPVGTLLQLARALEIDSGALLKEQQERVSSRAEEYKKRTDNYAYATLTPGAENKHLKAFQVTIESNQEHKGVGYYHEGEEFVYVLDGCIEIVVGDHENRLKAGESLHFNSGIKHNMRNPADDPAELLVVVYTP